MSLHCTTTSTFAGVKGWNYNEKGILCRFSSVWFFILPKRCLGSGLTI